MGELPVRYIKLEDVRLISTWLASRYDDGLIGHSVAKGLLKRLLAVMPDDIRKACAIVEECMAFEWSSEDRRGSNEGIGDRRR